MTAEPIARVDAVGTSGEAPKGIVMIIGNRASAIGRKWRGARASRHVEAAMLLGIVLVLSSACGGAVDEPNIGEVLTVVASDTSVPFGQATPIQLTATVVGTAGVNTKVTWALDPTPDGCAQLGASVTSDGLFSPPTSPNTFIGGYCKAVAAALADPGKTAVSTVTITEPSTPPGASPPPAPIVPPPAPPEPAGLAAFPGCEGAGCGSVGGRGGAVHRVTNLNDSGPGSLRACVEASGPRTCIFTTGGRINLAAPLNVRNPHLTIAGQTAPGGGIELVGTFGGAYVLYVRTHDVVVRYVRVFNGATCAANSQGCGVVEILRGSSKVVLDHLTVAYTADENMTVFGGSASDALTPKNITASWNVNAYALAAHQTGTNLSALTPEASEGMVDIDFHHNYYNVGHRIFGGGAKRVRWAYNIALNYQKAGLRSGQGITHDYVGNIYRCGNASTCSRWPYTLAQEFNYPNGTPSIYFHNNVWKDTSGAVKVAGDAPDAASWDGQVYVVPLSSSDADSTTPAPDAYRHASALTPAGVPIANGASGPYSGFVVAADGSNLERAMFDATAAGDATRGTAYGPVGASRRLDCNGNLVNNLDGLLKRVIAEYVGGGDPIYAPSGGTRSPTVQTDICWAPGQCGIPSLAPGDACPDSDGDGMPDEWEDHWGLNSGSAGGEDGSNGHKLSADYTNLEMYLDGYRGF